MSSQTATSDCDRAFMEPALWAAVDAIDFQGQNSYHVQYFVHWSNVQRYCDEPFVTEHSWNER